jgi:hypothetical protein
MSLLTILKGITIVLVFIVLGASFLVYLMPTDAPDSNDDANT